MSIVKQGVVVIKGPIVESRQAFRVRIENFTLQGVLLDTAGLHPTTNIPHGILLLELDTATPTTINGNKAVSDELVAGTILMAQQQDAADAMFGGDTNLLKQVLRTFRQKNGVV